MLVCYTYGFRFLCFIRSYRFLLLLLLLLLLVHYPRAIYISATVPLRVLFTSGNELKDFRSLIYTYYISLFRRVPRRVLPSSAYN